MSETSTNQSQSQSKFGWKNLVSLEGRIGRLEFFFKLLLLILLIDGREIVAELLSYPFIRPEDERWYALTGENPRIYNTFLFVSVVLGTIVGIAAGIRRLHDLGHQGWFVTLGLIAWFIADLEPYTEGIGSILVLVPWWAFSGSLVWKSGEPGPNRFGNVPT